MIEIDDGGHARDARLTELGFEVLRFWNAEVDRETEAVLDRIAFALGERS
ncbi:MAG: DUF559 domain-containing protein [Hyphomicrobiales bacterium]|nr:DUF559 domain-containing protein [Hyphomicrobiales bacterium]